MERTTGGRGHSDPRASASHGTVRSGSPAETMRYGERLGAAAAEGAFLSLVGPLGAGKTQLAKGVARGLGVRSVVNSPTFVLMNEHAGRLPFFHIDAYRLDDPEEALAAGLLDDRQAGGVTVAEWADRLEGWLPVERLDLELVLVPGEPMSREIRWRAHGTAHRRLALAATAPGDEIRAAS